MSNERIILNQLAKHYFTRHADWTEAQAIAYLQKVMNR